MEDNNKEESDSMLLSPTMTPRPRTVTCISAPDDSSQGRGSMARPRSKSVRNQVSCETKAFEKNYILSNNLQLLSLFFVG